MKNSEYRQKLNKRDIYWNSASLRHMKTFLTCFSCSTVSLHACRYITSYFQEKKILWVFPDSLFFGLCSFTVSGCKKSKSEGICTACIVMIINFVFHKIVLYRLITLVFLALALLYLCSGVKRVLIGLCYSVTFSKSNKVLDLKPPRTTEVSTRSHPNMPTIGPKNCFCEHILSVLKCLTRVMSHIYETFS